MSLRNSLHGYVDSGGLQSLYLTNPGFMMAQCTAHAQLKYVYGVYRVTCHRELGPPIFMTMVRGPLVKVNYTGMSRSPDSLFLQL